eukprot:2535013-Rhodomonas_salina.2
MQRAPSAGRRATSLWTAAQQWTSRATGAEIMPSPPSARRTETAIVTTIARTAATALSSATTRSPTSSAEREGEQERALSACEPACGPA